MNIGVMNMFSARKKKKNSANSDPIPASSVALRNSISSHMMRGEEWVDSCLSQWHECEANVWALIQTMLDYSGAINCQSSCKFGSMQVK